MALADFFSILLGLGADYTGALVLRQPQLPSPATTQHPFIIDALAGYGKTISAQQNFDGLHVWGKRRAPLQEKEKGGSTIFAEI